MDTGRLCDCFEILDCRRLGFRPSITSSNIIGSSITGSSNHGSTPFDPVVFGFSPRALSRPAVCN